MIARPWLRAWLEAVPPLARAGNISIKLKEQGNYQRQVVDSSDSPLVLLVHSLRKLIIWIWGGYPCHEDRQKTSKQTWKRNYQVNDCADSCTLPGIPWRLCTPQESWIFSLLSRQGYTVHRAICGNCLTKKYLTWMYWNPQTDKIPAKDPMAKEPPGVSIMSAQAPTATPPARVAFWRCSCNQAMTMWMNIIRLPWRTSCLVWPGLRMQKLP